MKYLSLIAMLVFVLACNNNQESENKEENTEVETKIEDNWAVFGDTIDIENINDMDEVLAMVSESGEVNVKLSGTIEECCQKKGCWMKVNIEGAEEPIRVTFKDYGFFVPLNSAGNTVVMEGMVKYDTVDVDVLKHYAEDAGQSQEEIDAITEPEVKLAFEAVGVKIKEKI